MDDTIQEEINPEARVPGELGGAFILEMLNECAGCSRQEQIHLPPTSLNTSDPRDTPDLPPFQVFVDSGKGSSKWLVQTKTPILQMAKLGPERVQIY